MSEQMTETKTPAESTEIASDSTPENTLTSTPDASTFDAPVTPAQADEILAVAKGLALKALADIAPVDSIGKLHRVEANEEFLVTHLFECLLPGYRGWFWFAILARVPDEKQATVCEIGLLPGEDSLLAPAWVPWAERLQDKDEADFEDQDSEEELFDEDFEEDSPEANEPESEDSVADEPAPDLLDAQETDNSQGADHTQDADHQ